MNFLELRANNKLTIRGTTVMECRKAIDLFGGLDVLAQRIIDVLSEDDSFTQSLLSGRNPVEIFKLVSRQQLIDHLGSCGISIDSLMTPQWQSDEVREHWLARMNSTGTGSGISSGGNIASNELLLETFVQLEALGELCQGKKSGTPRLSREKREKLRTKYQDEFGLNFS